MGERSVHLDVEDYEAYEVLEYQGDKYITNLWDEWAMLISAINEAERRDPKLGGPIEQLTDEIARLPHGSYVRIRMDIEVIDPQEAELEIKEATE